MATKPLLDFDALLAPIPGENPAGVLLRYTGDYDEIKSLQPKPDRDAFEASGQEGQWPKLIQIASQKIREKSKDLQIAAWLTEGLVHRNGFAGLRDGLKLIHGLLDRFWDHVYPLPDGDDLESRASPMQGMLEAKDAAKAIQWIGEVPLTPEPIKAPGKEEPVQVTYNLWYSIVQTQQADKKALQAPMEAAEAKAPAAFLQGLYGDLEEAEAALQALKQLMDQRFGPAAPGVSGASEALTKCKARLKTVLSKRGISVGSVEGNGQPGSPGEEGKAAANGAASGPISTRDDALSRLREVAEFFRQTEPHSPVPYLIQRAINWSRMSFDQLLVELVKDKNSRNEINSTLGIGVAEGKEKDKDKDKEK